MTNGLFTYITSNMDVRYFGCGYLFASLITLAVAFFTLDNRINRLEYITFALQPVAAHREEEVV